MDQLPDFIQKTTGLTPEIQTRILLSIAIFVSLLLIRYILLKLIWQKTTNVRTQYIWKRTITYSFTILGLLLLSNIWIKDFGRIGTIVGLVSAGLVIALKEPVLNIAGWVFILIRKPFTLGDRVQIGEFIGDVIDVRLFQFTLLEISHWVDADQSTGRIIDVPNGKVFIDVLANYTKGFEYIWHEIPVRLTFESNWEKAKNILTQIAHKHGVQDNKKAEEKIREAGKQFFIFYSYLTPIVYTSVREFGVLLTIRYMCEPRQRRGTEHDIWEDILREFGSHHDIQFAYPTTRFYNRNIEKKHKEEH